MSNKLLHIARDIKYDDFYTRFEDIEKELVNYKEQFRNKIILCNCDNPERSNFCKYFYTQFEELGLKELISIHYVKEGKSYIKKYRGIEDKNLDGCRVDLRGNGDFRNEECIEILKKVDIIVTNPPFSLFREFVVQIIKYNKKFLIIGNINAITYKEIFPLIRKNRIRVGCTNFNTGMYFYVDEDFEYRNSYKFKKDIEGKRVNRVANCCWFTNLEHRQKRIELIKEYKESYYKKYDNYDAIEVSNYKDIPKNYKGIMGVPITFLNHYNSEQFKILGIASSAKYNRDLVGIPLQKDGNGKPMIDNKLKYARIFIVRK